MKLKSDLIESVRRSKEAYLRKLSGSREETEKQRSSPPSTFLAPPSGRQDDWAELERSQPVEEVTR